MPFACFLSGPPGPLRTFTLALRFLQALESGTPGGRKWDAEGEKGS